MIKLIEIPKQELPEIIRLSYEGDTELLEKYHAEKYTLDKAVEKELSLIDNISKQVEVKCFKVLNGNNAIGYIVKIGVYLYSFAISIYSRTKSVLKEWWKAVCDEMGDKFNVALMSNNTRAIKYLKDRGFEIVLEENKKDQVREILLTN